MDTVVGSHIPAESPQTRDPVIQLSHVFSGEAVVGGHVNRAALAFFVGHHRTIPSEGVEEVQLVHVDLLKSVPLLLWFENIPRTWQTQLKSDLNNK